MSPHPKFLPWVVLACLTAVPFAARGADPDPDPSRHLALGMPAPAAADAANKDAYLLKKDWMSVSYNNSMGRPNWVAWNIRKDDFGNAPRPKNAFHPDATLPTDFPKVTPDDFKFGDTGFERGHMCPNADRDKLTARAKLTFVMTNMVAQTAELNEKAWANLEKYTRKLVDDSQEVYVFAGPEGKGGWSKEGYFNTTNGKVVVPAKCWKVVVCLPVGSGNPAARVTEASRVIAVVMPNDRTPTNAWGKWRVSAKDVEELTGYKFLDKVPEPVRKVLLDKVDDVAIPGG